jgi:nucleoside-diphosphate-sugar epimerase
MVCGTAHEARHFVKVFEGRARRAVVLSSADVYRAFDVMMNRDSGGLQITPIREDAVLRSTRFPYRKEANPIFKYYDKLLVEEDLAQTHGLPLTILRLPLVYGVGSLGGFSRHLAQMRGEVKTITFDGAAANWKACWSYAKNIAAAIALAITDERSVGRCYNLADPDPPTYREWLGQLAAEVGWKGVFLPQDRSQLLQDSIVVENPLQDWHLDTSRIRDELGFTESLGWREALASVIASSARNYPMQ